MLFNFSLVMLNFLLLFNFADQTFKKWCAPKAKPQCGSCCEMYSSFITSSQLQTCYSYCS